MDSLRGKLLVSSARLSDPNFARSVVLMLAHDENGALGLVLNRPMPVDLRKLSVEVLGEETGREGLLFRGGPCESAVMVVYDEAASELGINLSPGLRFSGDREVIEALLRDPPAGAHAEVRFFAGYAGWGTGQLEGELEEEAWLILPARPEHVFAPPESLWELARTELLLGGRVDPALMPRDPSIN